MMYKSMDKQREELLTWVATAGILGTMMATIRAVLNTKDTPAMKVRIFIAGVCITIFLTVLLMHSTLPFHWKGTIIGLSSAFINIFWPILENGATRLFKKKVDSIVDGSDHS